MRAIRSAVGLPARMNDAKRHLINHDGLTTWANPSDGRVLQKLDKSIDSELFEKMELGNDTFIYRFALPGRDSCLGHHTCQYLQLEADVVVD